MPISGLDILQPRSCRIKAKIRNHIFSRDEATEVFVCPFIQPVLTVAHNFADRFRRMGVSYGRVSGLDVSAVSIPKSRFSRAFIKYNLYIVSRLCPWQSIVSNEWTEGQKNGPLGTPSVALLRAKQRQDVSTVSIPKSRFPCAFIKYKLYIVSCLCP